MTAHVFDNLKDLNAFLATRKARHIFTIKHTAEVVNKISTPDGGTNFEIVDRFFVVEK